MAKRNRRKKSSGATDTNGKNLSKEEQFRLEYAYVIRDLRTVFILAGLMFLLLIGLNLLLQI